MENMMFARLITYRYYDASIEQSWPKSGNVEDKFKMLFLTAGLVYYKDLEKKHQLGLMIIRLFIKPIGNESLMV